MARLGRAWRGRAWQGNNAFRCAVTPGNFHTMSTEQIEQQPDIRSLPLWKDWIDRNEHRIAYGFTVTMEEMEEALDGKRGTVAFNIDVFKIREALRHRGMNFSERGLRGSGFHVMPANSNANTMEGMARAAVNALAAAVVLGSTTDQSQLTDQERQRHEAATQKAAARLALLSRKVPNAITAAAKQLETA